MKLHQKRQKVDLEKYISYIYLFDYSCCLQDHISCTENTKTETACAKPSFAAETELNRIAIAECAGCFTVCINTIHRCKKLFFSFYHLYKKHIV